MVRKIHTIVYTYFFIEDLIPIDVEVSDLCIHYAQQDPA